MALYYDLQVYKDVYRLTLLLFQYTKDFPKEYKYSLGGGYQEGHHNPCTKYLSGQ